MMNEMRCRETQGRTSLHTDSCGHDCGACLTDFERTQRAVEDLHIRLLQESADNQRLWLEVRAAMRNTLFDLVPAQRIAGVPGESAEFRTGWDRCRAEIEHRIRELGKVL